MAGTEALGEALLAFVEGDAAALRGVDWSTLDEAAWRAVLNVLVAYDGADGHAEVDRVVRLAPRGVHSWAVKRAALAAKARPARSGLQLRRVVPMLLPDDPEVRSH